MTLTLTPRRYCTWLIMWMRNLCVKFVWSCACAAGGKIYVLTTRNGSRCKQLSNITVKGIQARIDTDSSWILLLLLSLHFEALIFGDQRLEILLQGPQISIPPRTDGSLKRSVPEYACGNLSLWAQLPASVSVYHINRLHSRLKWSSIWHHTSCRSTRWNLRCGTAMFLFLRSPWLFGRLPSGKLT